MTPEETSILMKIASDAADTKRSLQDLKWQLLGNGQPGFMTDTNRRLEHLEYGDMRRTWIERAVSGVVALVVSMAVALLHIWNWKR